MANINVVVGSYIGDGYKVKFRTPCDSTTIEGLEVKYPAKNGIGTLIKKFVFKDAHGTELSGVGNLFVRGVMIEVLLDVTHSVAYIQNADTNSYVESFKSEIQRLEESQKEFLTVAGIAVERCEAIADSADGFEQAMNDATERAESVQGVYVGEGDMPEGYSLQIDPNGEVFDVDSQLNTSSKNPIENRVAALKFVDIDSEIAEIKEYAQATQTELSETANKVNSNAGAIESLRSETRILSDHSLDHEDRILTMENAQAAAEHFKLLSYLELTEKTDVAVADMNGNIENYALLSAMIYVSTDNGLLDYPMLFFRKPKTTETDTVYHGVLYDDPISTAEIRATITVTGNVGARIVKCDIFYSGTAIENSVSIALLTGLC